MLGGLLQLVAYGNQDLVVLRNWDGIETKYKNNKAGKCRFFYDKKRTKSKSKLKQDETRKSGTRESEYVYSSNNNRRTPINVFQQQSVVTTNKIVVQKPLTVREKAIKYFKRCVIQKWEKFMEIKHAYDKRFARLFYCTKQIRFYDKRYIIKRVNNIDFCITQMTKFLAIPTGIRNYILYFERSFWDRMNNMLNKHQLIGSGKIEKAHILKNTECPITYIEITDLYLECKTCKSCFDYNSTKHYFKTKKHCACCRAQLSLTPFSLTRDEIYIYLKDLSENNK